MSSRIRFLLPLACAWLAAPVLATDLAYIRCAGNEDRVWVYDSLSTFDVQAKLKCGEPVEILHRVNGFVMIRTGNGVEGYVPDSAFPDLPAVPDQTARPLASAVSRSVAAAGARPVPVAAVGTNPVPAAPVAATAPVAAQTGPAVAVAPVPAKVSAQALMPQAISASVASSSTPASNSGGRTFSSDIKPVASAPQALTIPAPSAAKTPSVVANVASANSFSPSARSYVPAADPVAAPAKPAIETVSSMKKDSAVTVPATAQMPASAEESENYPDTQPQFDSADPSCRIYFAAYGLTPLQYKWLSENRRQEFAAICPAPDPAHVDYVFLFAQDSASYTGAMPKPVHFDGNSGFSDFSPLATADKALLTEAEKPRFESVWVFRMTRGAFDPARFSPRRRPQFTTYVKGSRASSRALEDAFNFAETHGVSH